MAVRKIVQDSTYPATQPDPLETLPYWGKGTDEDITSLPPGWEARVTSDGRVFFVNHNKRVTQWTYPKTNMKYRVLPYLPYGWQVFKDEDNVLVYVDHMDHICTKIDPRLLSKTAYDYPDEYGIRSFNPLQHRIKPYARASDVLEGVDLKGKVAMVTGASSGLGFETASCLAGYGARVIMVSRDPIRSTEALKSIQDKNPLAHVECHEMDLGSLSSVREFARKFIASGLPLDILICNGGVFEPSFELSKDGLEKHFAVNYFGHFYLIRLLKDVLIESKPSRVVIVSSDAHRFPSIDSNQLDLKSLQHPSKDNYNPWTAYGTSKLCCLLLTLELHRRYGKEGISCNAVHPGNLLPTNLLRKANCLYKGLRLLARPFTSSVAQGISSIVYCAGHPLMDRISGLYIYRCQVAEPSKEAQSNGTSTALWQFSEQILHNKTKHLQH